MGHKTMPRILPEDTDLMVRIAKHGFVDMDYVYLFAYPGRKKETINRRIIQLSYHDYIIINKTFIPSDYTASNKSGYKIIALGKRGIQLMEDMGYEVIDNIRTIQNSSPYRMYHQVQVATVCDTLQQQYEQGQSQWYVNEVLNEREAYLEDAFNQPDAILNFKRKNMRNSPSVFVFLELERSYTKQTALERKLRGYHHLIENDLYAKAFTLQIIDHRVLFVSKTQNQKELLITKVQDCKDRVDFHLLAAGYEDVIKHPLESIYMIPGDQVKSYKLMGALP